MSLRLYLCPTVGDGVTTDTAFRAGLHDLRVAAATVGDSINSLKNILLPSSFFLCASRMSSWASVDLDTTLVKLLDSADLPDTITTWSAFKAFLQSKTVGDIPLARRQALNTRLQSFGFDTTQVTLATTWWQLLIGMIQQMGYTSNADLLAIV